MDPRKVSRLRDRCSAHSSAPTRYAAPDAMECCLIAIALGEYLGEDAPVGALTKQQIAYIEAMPVYVLRENLRADIYSRQMAHHVRRILDRHDEANQDPLDKPQSKQEMDLGS